MNVAELARKKYGKNSIHSKSQRDTEYEVIARISHRLKTCTADREHNFPAFVAALSENQKLWSTLAEEVARSDNLLPPKLRADLFWLAEFVISETQKILIDSDAVYVNTLIEINAAILHGLRRAEKKT